MTSDVCWADEVRVGGLTFRDCPITALDRTMPAGTARVLGTDVPGIIGHFMLRHLLAAIDYVNGLVYFAPGW